MYLRPYLVEQGHLALTYVFLLDQEDLRYARGLVECLSHFVGSHVLCYFVLVFRMELIFEFGSLYQIIDLVRACFATIINNSAPDLDAQTLS
jgi:hypothetical protein